MSEPLTPREQADDDRIHDLATEIWRRVIEIEKKWLLSDLTEEFRWLLNKVATIEQAAEQRGRVAAFAECEAIVAQIESEADTAYCKSRNEYEKNIAEGQLEAAEDIKDAIARKKAGKE